MKHFKHWLATIVVLLCSVTVSAATYSDWTSTNKGQSDTTSSNSYTITANAGDILSFAWLVSSESGWDKLIITIGGTEILNKSGELSGTYQHTFTASGTYTMVVKYTKDGSVNKGDDYAKVYNIVLDSPASSGTDNLIASGACGDNLTWKLTDDGELIIEGTGEMTSTPWNASHSLNIKKVTINEGVLSIGNYAFNGCSNLVTVNIPESIKSVGWNILGGTKWYNDQPNGVVYAGKILFDYKGTIPENTSINVKDGIRCIAPGAFLANEELTSITLPNSLVYIGAQAFYCCTNLTSVNIPEGVTSIGNKTFCECSSLTSPIIIPSSVESIGDEAFFNCGKLSSITFSEGITNIGEYAFQRCGSLVDLVLPQSLISIGNCAFESCVGLTSVSVSGNITSMGNAIFSYCRNIISAEIRNDIKIIGTRMFEGCQSLSSLTCYAQNPPAVEYNAFKGISSAAILYVPKSSLLTYETEGWINYFSKIEALPPIVIASGTTYGNNLTWKLTDEGELTIEGEGEMQSSPWSQYESSIKSVVIGEGVTSICSYAFFNCTNLTSIDIPESVSKIGQYAFANTGWHNNQPNGLVYIENWLYGYKGEMPENFELVVEEDTKGIADYAFENCSGLMTATIPESVSYIGMAAFIQSGLSLISMSEGVKSIGGGAFWGCYRLEGVSIPESVTEVESDILDETSWYRNQPCGMLYLSGWALGLKICGECDICQKMNSQISILEGTKGLADGCLYEYSSAIIPESVTYFCNGALESNRGDFNIICKALVPSCNVDEKTFEYVKNRAILYVPASAINAYKSDTYWGEFANIQAINFPVWTLTTEGELIVDGVGAMDNYGVSERSPWAIYDTSIKSVTVKEGITSVGDNAFVYCEEIESVSLPNSLTSIGVGAFAECANLKSIVIPENVTTLGDGAFHGCGISYISCNAMTPPVIAEYTFHYVSKSIPVYVPLSSIPSYSNTEYWNEFTDIQAMPEFITINQYGSGTYCSEYALDFSEVEGLKAYAATGYNTRTGVVTLTRVMTAKAGEGLFIKGEPGDYMVPVMEDTDDNTLNMLVGTLTNTDLNGTSDDGNYTNYKYTIKVGDAEPMFYQFDDGSTLSAERAYLQIPTKWLPQVDSKAIRLRFVNGETTDIEEVESTDNSEQTTVIYDLMGRRVENPSKGCVYIVNGKKIVY